MTHAAQRCRPPTAVALQAGQVNVVPGVALGVVQAVNAELAGVLCAGSTIGAHSCRRRTGRPVFPAGRGRPQHAGRWRVPFAASTRLLADQLASDVSLHLLSGIFRRAGRAVKLWRRTAAAELPEILNAAHGEVTEVAPLDAVIHDPDTLGVLDRQALA